MKIMYLTVFVLLTASTLLIKESDGIELRESHEMREILGPRRASTLRFKIPMQTIGSALNHNNQQYRNDSRPGHIFYCQNCICQNEWSITLIDGGCLSFGVGIWGEEN